MNKFEKLIEYIINEDEAKAKALFHQIVVEKSRDIYESLVEEDIHIHNGSQEPVQEAPIEADMGAEDLGAEIGGAQDEIAGDEMGGLGDELGGEEMGDDEMGGDDMGAELGGDDMGGEEGLEDRVMDLEDAIDELKAEFDNLMGAEEAEGHDDLGGEEGEDGGEEDFGGEMDDAEGDAEDLGGEDEVGTDELGDEDDVEGDAKFGEASVYGGQTGNSKTMESKKSDKKDKAEDKKDAKKDKKDAKKDVKETKSPSDLMREYVEKVSLNWPKSAGDGDEIGAAGKKQPINSKSPVISGKNDMGGTTANMTKGGEASDKDSNTGPKDPSNEYTKGGGKGKKMGQDKYENSPAANTKGYKDKRTVKREQEGQTTKDSVSVDKKSFNPGGKSGYKG